MYRNTTDETRADIYNQVCSAGARGGLWSQKTRYISPVALGEMEISKNILQMHA